MAASATVECITSGASTPATTPLATLPTQACKDAAMPRRSGAMSSTISVTTGTIRAQPKANTPKGGRAQAGCGGNSKLIARFSKPIASMMAKPRRICRRGRMRPASRPLT